jgi:hypothetical protein
MGEMNQPPPPQAMPPVAAPPPMGMQPMMGQAVGAGAVHMAHEQFHHLAYCVHSNPSWGKLDFASLLCRHAWFVVLEP